MNRMNQRLLRHLAWAVVLKLVALFVLWFLFVHDQSVPVDPARLPFLSTGVSK